MICKECKKEIDFSYYKEIIEKMKKQHLCFTCLFWTEYVERKDELKIVRIKGRHYVIGDENSKLSFRGFSGNKFKIKFNDGREIITTNLWCQGYIPDWFKDRLPDNAKFIKERK